MRLEDFVDLDREEYKRKVVRGEIKGFARWPVYRGNWLYYEQWKRGDRASDGEKAERAEVCRACKHLTARHPLGDEKLDVSWHCGQPAWSRDEWDRETGTCGCPVGISLNGEPLQEVAGMAACAKEECPLGKW